MPLMIATDPTSKSGRKVIHVATPAQIGAKSPQPYHHWDDWMNAPIQSALINKPVPLLKRLLST